ncbi:MAG: tetratricopeptide repeat protein [Pyrinomonadaceae bacterium]|nr:tetratricopeptide repeat protein [Pyrinomonadaceae bacterium]
MAQSKVELFAQMAREQPANEMIWYGLASEYVKLERWREAAEALSQVVQLNPDYTAAYQMLGTSLANLGEHEEARRVWREGIEVAKRTRAWKAQQHMEGLLANVNPIADSSGLCTE